MPDGTPTVPPEWNRGFRASEFNSAHTGPDVADVDPLYTRDEVLSILKVGPTTLNKLVQSEEIRSLKIGKSRRFPASAIREFVAARMSNSS